MPVMEQLLWTISIVLPTATSETKILFSLHVHREPSATTVKDLTEWTNQLKKEYGLEVDSVYLLVWRRIL